MSILDAAGGIASALLSKGPVSAPDLSALFQMIDAAGVNQRSLINQLPLDLQKQYADYKASNAATGAALQTGTTQLGQNLLARTEANYDPNAPAVRAAEDAAKTAIYANLPGQQNAIRQALAATGGFDRGTASKQLAAPVLQAGQQYGQQVANITAQQLQQKQSATQSAINTINTMDDQTLQSLFGMNKEQAMTILNSNRQDLKDQLTSLITQSNNQLQQKLGVEGANITNQYNNAVANNADYNARLNGIIGGVTGAAGSIGTGGISNFLSPSTSETGFNPDTMSTNVNYNKAYMQAL